MNFTQYLRESFSSESDNSHYTHIEDFLYVDGAKSIPKILVSIIELVKGIPTTQVQTKIDGSPSCFYFYKDGKFAVATKSIFNADPKINYTDKDIETNHGHAPGLVSKLKLALRYLPSITRDDHKNTVCQGDVMFAPEDVTTQNIDGESYYIFKPNVVVNAVPVDSDIGQQIKHAKFGFAPHTKYTEAGKRTSITPADIQHSSTVFIMPIDAPILSDYTVIQAGINRIRKELEGCSRSGLAFASSNEISPLLLQYVNFTVKNNSKETLVGFTSFVKTKYEKELNSVKTEKTRTIKTNAMNNMLETLKDNSDGLENVITVHELIGRLKDLIISELDKKQPIRRFFFKGSELVPTNPEGYVGMNNHGTSKFVNRAVFSKQNFIQNARAVSESEDRTAVIVPLGRFNPPHKDHMNLIDATLKLAKQVNGTPLIFVSTTQDSNKNPLSADEKIFYLKKMYPNIPGLFHKPSNINTSIIGVLKELNGKFSKIFMVLGDDRIDVIRRTNKYNNIEYSFKEIKGVSRHDITNTRTTDGDGVHASDIRRWCKEGDFESVRNAMSPKLSDSDVQTIINKIKTRTK